jgi:hypothetical protein
MKPSNIHRQLSEFLNSNSESCDKPGFIDKLRAHFAHLYFFKVGDAGMITASVRAEILFTLQDIFDDFMEDLHTILKKPRRIDKDIGSFLIRFSDLTCSNGKVLAELSKELIKREKEILTLNNLPPDEYQLAGCIDVGSRFYLIGAKKDNIVLFPRTRSSHHVRNQ